MGISSLSCTKEIATVSSQNWQIVGDYWEVNAKLAFCPRIVSNLGPEASVFTVLDMTSGYHCCPLATGAQPVIVFVTPKGVFQYRVLPFGLKPALHVFHGHHYIHVLRLLPKILYDPITVH